MITTIITIDKWIPYLSAATTEKYPGEPAVILRSTSMLGRHQISPLG